MGNVILGLLMASPHTLYSLRKQFERGISLFYSASLGSLRTAVIALLDRGLVTAVDSIENGRSKKTYSITDAGRAAFLAWMLEPIRGDVETVALSRLFFLGLLEAEDRAHVLTTIADRIAQDEAELLQVAAELDSLTIPEEYSTQFRYQRLVLEYGLRAHHTARDFFATVRASEDTTAGERRD